MTSLGSTTTDPLGPHRDTSSEDGDTAEPTLSNVGACVCVALGASMGAAAGALIVVALGLRNADLASSFLVGFAMGVGAGLAPSAFLIPV